MVPITGSLYSLDFWCLYSASCSVSFTSYNWNVLSIVKEEEKVENPWACEALRVASSVPIGLYSIMLVKTFSRETRLDGLWVYSWWLLSPRKLPMLWGNVKRQFLLFDFCTNVTCCGEKSVFICKKYWKRKHAIETTCIFRSVKQEGAWTKSPL